MRHQRNDARPQRSILVVAVAVAVVVVAVVAVAVVVAVAIVGTATAVPPYRIVHQDQFFQTDIHRQRSWKKKGGAYVRDNHQPETNSNTQQPTATPPNNAPTTPKNHVGSTGSSNFATRTEVPPKWRFDCAPNPTMSKHSIDQSH